ncbi:hypothetical protein [Spirillospora sp. CA-128828]|uniref:hypothetical protein n=1 Tax=Spirillospora sp. CA-128828 TaxID=3240033 RepID=UPI003D8CEA55
MTAFPSSGRHLTAYVPAPRLTRIGRVAPGPTSSSSAKIAPSDGSTMVTSTAEESPLCTTSVRVPACTRPQPCPQ